MGLIAYGWMWEIWGDTGHESCGRRLSFREYEYAIKLDCGDGYPMRILNIF